MVELGDFTKAIFEGTFNLALSDAEREELPAFRLFKLIHLVDCLIAVDFKLVEMGNPFDISPYKKRLNDKILVAMKDCFTSH